MLPGSPMAATPTSASAAIAAAAAATAAVAALPEPDNQSPRGAGIHSPQPTTNTGSSDQERPAEPEQAPHSLSLPPRVPSPAPQLEQPPTARESVSWLGEAALSLLRSLSRPLSALALSRPSSASSASVAPSPTPAAAAAPPAPLVAFCPSPRAVEEEAERAARQAEEERALQAIFTELDRDGNGFIGRADVQAVLRDLNLQAAATDTVVTAMLEMGCSEGAAQQLSFTQFRSLQQQYGVT